MSPDKDTEKDPSWAREANIKQFERLTEDWRFHHKLIWEIPTVAVAIMAGILAVAYTQFDEYPAPRVILLVVGGVLLCGLTIAVVKDRFGADYRTAYIGKLESELGMSVLPLITKQSRKQMVKDGIKYTNRGLFGFIVNHDILSAEQALGYLTFLAAALLISLAVYEVFASFGVFPNIV